MRIQLASFVEAFLGVGFRLKNHLPAFPLLNKRWLQKMGHHIIGSVNAILGKKTAHTILLQTYSYS